MEVGEVFGTGERADVVGRPKTHEEQDHLSRYRWAAAQVSGRILDVACGTGYGMKVLAERGAATGLDSHSGAVEVARSRGVDAQVATVPPLRFPDATFDAIVSFETIEHVNEDDAFVAEIRRVLKPNGLLFLSTPNKDKTSPFGPPQNPWHEREYTLADLLHLLREFRDLEVFMQGPQPHGAVRSAAHRLVARFPSLCRPGRWWDRLAHGDGSVVRWSGVESPTIWVIRAHR